MGDHHGLLYLVFTPRAATGRETPLLIFLHARDEAGHSRRHLRRLKAHSVPYLAATDRLPRLSDTEPFPFIIACPQTAQRGDWSDDVPRVKSLLDALVHDHGADPARRYVTGVSQGAIGAWELAAAAPAQVAAIAPVSWDLPSAAKHAVTTPAWILVGADDDKYDAATVGPKLSALRPNSDRTRFCSVPNAKHDKAFWNEVYASGELYRWFLNYSAEKTS